MRVDRFHFNSILSLEFITQAVIQIKKTNVIERGTLSHNTEILDYSETLHWNKFI